MADFVKCAIPNRYIGAHADTKPAVCGVGSICYETDTGAEYITADGGTTWTLFAPTVYLADISAETLTLSGGAGALTFSAAATIVAASGLTMPAFTLGGAVTGNAQTVSDINLTVGAARTLDVSAGTLTLAADQISGDKVEGGTINAITINTLTLGTSLAGADKPFTGLGDFTFTDGSIIATATSDSATLIFKATDDDGAALAQLEVMRLVGANDPYVAFGGSQQNLFYNSGAVTIGGNMTFGAGLALASGAVNGNTLLLKANDTTFITLATGATDTMTLGNFTSGTITMANGYSIKTDGNSSYYSLSGIDSDTSTATPVAQVYSGADPYFRVGRDDTGVALNSVTDMFYLQAGSGTGNNAAGFGLGMPWYLGNAASETEERASIDCVLVTATNGAEAAQFNINLQTGGAAPSLAMSIDAAGIIVPDTLAIRAAGTADDTFYLKAYRSHANNLDYVSAVQVKNTGTENGTALLGFYGATPVAQQTKATHNNWAALSDVVSALVNLGLLDTA